MQIPPAAVPLVVVSCLFTSLAFIIVSLRLVTRVSLIKNVGADDYLIAAAMCASIAFLAIVFLQIKAGLGRKISLEELPGFLQALWATIPFYNLSLVLCKLSITVQCYRVLRAPTYQKTLKVIFCILVVYGLWTVFSTTFNCWPIAAYWGATQGITGTCLDKNVLTFSNAALNIASDIVLVGIPAPLLWKLQIPKKQKIILIAVFGVGIFACVTSIVRLHALYTIGITPVDQQSVGGVDIAVWSGIEINVAIICASIPSLKALVVKVMPKLLSSSLYASTKRQYYGNESNTTSRHMRSKNAKNDITVIQSIEMQVVPSGGGEFDRGSRDGSEKNLVTSAWQAECYTTNKNPRNNVNSHPNGMV